MSEKEKNSKSEVSEVTVSETISRERQLEIIFNTSTDIIFLISIEAGPRYRFTSVNPSFLSATGLNRAQVEGKYITEVVPESSQSMVIAKYQQAIIERKTIQWEETSDYPAGKKTGIVSITPVFNDKNECTMLMGTVHDITARKESERILKESEFKLRMVAENGLLGMAWASAEGKLLNANLTFCKMLGYTLDEILGVYFGNFTHPDDTQKEEHLIKQMAKGEIDNYRMEKRYKTKQGHYIWVELNLTCYRDIVDKNIEFFIGIIQDINDRKKAEEQVLKEKELSESIINSLPGIFYLFDNTGKYLRWNKNHETVPGYTTEEMRLMYPLNFFDADEKELIKEKIEKVFTEGYATAEANFMGKDGQKTPYYFNGIAIEYEGKPCLMGVAFDVSARKKIEQELREAELKFRTLAEKSQVGVYIVQKGKFTYVNPRFAEVFGYDPNELLHTDPVETIISEEYKSVAKENVRARLEGEINTVHYEVTGKKKDGSFNRVEFYGSRTMYGGKPTIIGTMIDITERKKAEEALQKSEANLHTIFDTTDTIYTLLDNNFQVMSFNKQAFDFIKNELQQEFKLNTNLISYFPKNRQSELYERMKRVLAGAHINYESSYPQHDGSLTWYYVRMFPITNNEKIVFGMMVAISDITEKKRLEQEIMDRKIQEQKKMTRAVLNAQERERNKIGQELHDNVNQILVGTKMYLGLAGEEKPVNETLIQQSIALIDNAINEIRTLTHDYVTPQRSVHLKDIIQLLVDNLSKHSSIKTKFVYDPGSIEIKDDLKLNIYRIIQESINNILKHASAKNASFSVKADTEGLHVVIKDDGLGFDTAARKTKGIGLSNMLNRVESYNGKMTIKSKPGKGCKIELTIPL